MTKKILIAGGGWADIPMIKAAKSLGLYVITSGNRPDELGHAYSDEYRKMDFSDREGIYRLAESLNVDYICPCCNDFSALSAAYAAEKLGLPGLDSVDALETLMHKDRFRAFATAHGIPVPNAGGYSSFAEAAGDIGRFRFPVLVKPVDLSGGKGFVRLDRPDDLTEGVVAHAVARSRTNRFVIEEYITSDDCQHNFVAFLSGGKVVFYNSDNEHYFRNPYLVWGMSIPTASPKSIDEELCRIAERIAAILDLKPGILLMQHASRDGKPIIIESTRRMPGNYHGELIKYATGCDVSAWAIKTAMGDDCGGIVHSEPTGYFAEHCIMSDRNGEVKGISFNESIEDNIIERLIWSQNGDAIEDFMVDKLGIVIMKFGSFDEMWSKTERMNNIIHAEVE
ncbi:MAG: hypothetical protein LBR38_03385 [Synergistaceae bacterium]|jgi:biotin carboxylase|nr:hypothetical protein [Synergistaceae bacterium]